MVGDGVELVGVSQTGDLVGVELEDEIPGGGNGTLKVQKYSFFFIGEDILYYFVCHFDVKQI